MSNQRILKLPVHTRAQTGRRLEQMGTAIDGIDADAACDAFISKMRTTSSHEDDVAFLRVTRS